MYNFTHISCVHSTHKCGYYSLGIAVKFTLLKGVAGHVCTGDLSYLEICCFMVWSRQDRYCCIWREMVKREGGFFLFVQLEHCSKTAICLSGKYIYIYFYRKNLNQPETVAIYIKIILMIILLTFSKLFYIEYHLQKNVKKKFSLFYFIITFFSTHSYFFFLSPLSQYIFCYIFRFVHFVGIANSFFFFI